jgi:hypothetical protein
MWTVPVGVVERVWRGAVRLKCTAIESTDAAAGEPGRGFAHEDAQGRPVFALSRQTFGAELDVHAEFDTPGLYRLWGKFGLASGHVATVPFTVEAS